ncbi:MAG: LysM peptidoglycan-binding domain-containing protein [Gammaproteobacteria bacterium]|nr:LysM peptidoglycan-binding domain-containing protein [Gammaproteobacteria bacterium]MCW8909448.1 LysM peptidoglycan-binding domain-containing protein [Gammaproteobacteria bacterium]MCW9004126.1 LysM peptidoglycan-binding domain-containing protein [Gammaproteobacteria bacterium]MCW9055223.1 LysM peptidoglycan-binding domain-containing protein [Gammaproteobacteria bacterium]
MKTDFLAKPLVILMMSLGLAVGCASTEEMADSSTPADQVEAQPVQAEEAVSDSSQSSSSTDSYTVMSGDNLWNISAKGDIYANPYQWPLIYKANRSQIKDADLIYSGQVLDIDRNASSSDVDAAIEHAKTRGAWSLGVVEDSDTAYLNQ